MWKTIKSKDLYMNIYVNKNKIGYEILYPRTNKLTEPHIKNMLKKGYRIERKSYVLNAVNITYVKG